MARVVLDIARLLFAPSGTSYVRTPAGSEALESLAAHLRGIAARLDTSSTGFVSAPGNFATNEAKGTAEFSGTAVTMDMTNSRIVSADTVMLVCPFNTGASVQVDWEFVSPGVARFRRFSGVAGNQKVKWIIA